MRIKLYMVVTKDKYELPLGVYDSLDELAEKQGVNKNYVKQSISRYEHGTNKCFVPFRRVKVNVRKEQL